MKNKTGAKAPLRVVRAKFNLDRRLVECLPACAALDDESVDAVVTRALAGYVASTLEYYGKQMSAELEALVASVDTPA